MSYDDNEWGAYTELEISAGVPRLVEGRDHESDMHHEDLNATENQFDEDWQDTNAERYTEAIKAIAHLRTVEQVQHKLLRMLINQNLNVMIDRYVTSEKLPESYKRIARHRNALPEMLKGYFKLNCEGEITPDLITDIEFFCVNLYQNDELDIVYDRVNRIQKYVHYWINEIFGVDSHLTLPIPPIRNLLSAARLHLNIVDLEQGGTEELNSILKRSQLAAEAERSGYGGCVSIPRGKRYIKNWRVLHLDSLFQFQDYEIGCKIYGLMDLAKNVQLKDFKLKAANVFSGRSGVPDMRDWTEQYRWK